VFHHTWILFDDSVLLLLKRRSEDIKEGWSNDSILVRIEFCISLLLDFVVVVVVVVVFENKASRVIKMNAEIKHKVQIHLYRSLLLFKDIFG
jgi:hypothetical protein